MKMGQNIKFVSYIVQWKNAARKICVIFYAHFRFWPNDADQLDVNLVKKFFIFKEEEEEEEEE